MIAPLLLSVLVVAELAVAVHRHRRDEELAATAVSGPMRSRIDSIFKLARRGDGAALTRERALRAFENGDIRVRAFLRTEGKRAIDLATWEALIDELDSADRDLIRRLAIRSKSYDEIVELHRRLSGARDAD